MPHHTPHCTPTPPAQAVWRHTPLSPAPSNTPPLLSSSRTCTGHAHSPRTARRTHRRDTPSCTHDDSAATASRTSSRTKTTPAAHSTSHFASSSRRNSVVSRPAGTEDSRPRDSTPEDTDGCMYVVPHTADDTPHMEWTTRDTATSSAILQTSPRNDIHVSHTPTVSRTLRRRTRVSHDHSTTLKPFCALPRTPSPPSRGTVDTARRRDTRPCTDGRKGASEDREACKEDRVRDGRNGAEFWHDGRRWAFRTNRDISGRWTVCTLCTGRSLLSCRSRTPPGRTSRMSDNHPGDMAVGMCDGHSSAPSHKSMCYTASARKTRVHCA